MNAPRIAVLGAGPTGLEAALAAQRRGWDVTVYESAPHVAGHVRAWGHVRLFTPWSMSVSPSTADLLGLELSDTECPTGHDYADHLERVATRLGDRVVTRTRVEAIAREGLLKDEEIGSDVRAARPFRLLVTGSDGEERFETADVVLDCTGTYGNPAPTGAGGIPAQGERRFGDRVVRQIPDVIGTPERWLGRDVLLVGAGNSAQTVARDLALVGARLTWAVRAASPTWGAVQDDVLPDRAALVASSRALAHGGAQLHTGVVVERLQQAAGDRIAVTLRDAGGRATEVEVDEVVSMTGAVGDSSLYRQLQVHECYATEGPMSLAATLLGSEGGDCLTQVSAGVDALRNPEPRFFVLGIKSYGRAPTFLMATGYEQVRSVAAHLAGDEAAASAVRLVLPETGVCSTSLAPKVESCCGGSTKKTDASAPAIAKAKISCCGGGGA